MYLNVNVSIYLSIYMYIFIYECIYIYIQRQRDRETLSCRRFSARGYISPIPVHNLPRLRTSNVDRCNERKWLYTEKFMMPTIPRTIYDGCELR